MIVPDTVSLATLTPQKLVLIVLCPRSVHAVDQQPEDFRSLLWRAWCLMFCATFPSQCDSALHAYSVQVGSNVGLSAIRNRQDTT